MHCYIWHVIIFQILASSVKSDCLFLRVGKVWLISLTLTLTLTLTLPLTLTVGRYINCKCLQSFSPKKSITYSCDHLQLWPLTVVTTYSCDHLHFWHLHLKNLHLSSDTCFLTICKGSLGTYICKGSLGTYRCKGSLGTYRYRGSLGTYRCRGSLGTYRGRGSLGHIDQLLFGCWWPNNSPGGIKYKSIKKVQHAVDNDAFIPWNYTNWQS